MRYDSQIYELIKRRAAYPVYLRYNINRYELSFLWQLSGLLRHYNRQITAKDDIFSTITGNTKDLCKYEGYLKGCIHKHFINTYSYVSQPGSLSLGISDLGLSVLRFYKAQLDRLSERYKSADNKAEEFPTSLTEHPAPRYIPNYIAA